jgi:hypothetical protein
MLETVSYTQVLPTAMGTGIDPAGVNELEVAPDVAPDVDAALAVALAAPAGLEARAVGLLADATGAVFAEAPHPASAITAAPARTARVDLYLLMLTPRPVK